MKKHYYFMNKPELILNKKEVEKNEQLKKEAFFHYKDHYKNDHKYLLKKNSSSKIKKLKSYAKFIYIINFIILIFMASYWSYFNYINSPIKTSLEEKLRYFVNNELFFSLEKKEHLKKIYFSIYINNIGSKNFSFKKDYTFEFAVITEENKEIYLKKDKIYFDKKIKAHSRLEILQFSILKEEVLNKKGILLSVFINENFTLYQKF